MACHICHFWTAENGCRHYGPAVRRVELKFKEGRTTFIQADGVEITLRAVNTNGDMIYFLQLGGVDVLSRTADELFNRYGDQINEALEVAPLPATELVAVLLLNEYRTQ